MGVVGGWVGGSAPASFVGRQVRCPRLVPRRPPPPPHPWARLLACPPAPCCAAARQEATVPVGWPVCACVSASTSHLLTSPRQPVTRLHCCCSTCMLLQLRMPDTAKMEDMVGGGGGGGGAVWAVGGGGRRMGWASGRAGRQSVGVAPATNRAHRHLLPPTLRRPLPARPPALLRNGGRKLRTRTASCCSPCPSTRPRRRLPRRSPCP